MSTIIPCVKELQKELELELVPFSQKGTRVELVPFFRKELELELTPFEKELYNH